MAVCEVALFWPSGRSDELFEDFEVQLRELLRDVGRAAAELMLAVAEARDRREPSTYSVGETVYRMSTPEPRSFDTWFGVIRYARSYARPVDGGVGHCPLDFELGLLGDRTSPNLLSTGARLATRMSFAEAREVLGWFVPQPPSTEVLEQTVLGLGHHTGRWFEVAPIPEGDGEVLVVMLDGKCVPTARASELQKRRGERAAIRYLERRLDKLNYGTCRVEDLEVGTGQVEGAIKYVIAMRCDHGGMRWIRQRAQAVIQLRCVDVNGHWHAFVRWALARLRTTALADGRRARLQTNTPAKLPNVAHAA